MSRVTLFVLVTEYGTPLIYKAKDIATAINNFERDHLISIKQCYDYAVSIQMPELDIKNKITLRE